MPKPNKIIKLENNNIDDLIAYFWVHDFYYAEIKRRHAKKAIPNLRENVEIAKSYFLKKLSQEYDLKYIIILGLLRQTQSDTLLINKILTDNQVENNLLDENLGTDKVRADKLLTDFDEIKQLPPDGIKLLNYLVDVSSYFEYYPDDLCQMLEAKEIKEILVRNISTETIEVSDLPKPPIPAFFYSISEYTAKCHICLADKNDTAREYGDPRPFHETMPLEEYARLISASYIHQRDQSGIEGTMLDILKIIDLPKPCFKQNIVMSTTPVKLKKWSQQIGNMYELFTVAWHCNKQLIDRNLHKCRIKDELGALLLEGRKKIYQGKDTSEPKSFIYKRLIGLYLADDTNIKKSVKQVLNFIFKNRSNTTEYNKHKKMAETAIGTGRPWILDERKYPYVIDGAYWSGFSCGCELEDFDISSLDLK